MDLDAAVRPGAESAGHVGLAVAGLGGEAPLGGGRLAGHPVHGLGGQAVGVEQRVVLALDRDQHVALEVLADHVPGGLGVVGQPADAEPLALAQGVVHQAHVLADRLALRGLDHAGLGGQVLLEEIAKAPLADEADAGGVLLAGGHQVVALGDGAHLGLLEFAHREEGAGDGRLGHGVEEVALVLVGIEPLEEPRTQQAVGGAADLTLTNIVAGGDLLGAEHLCVLQEHLELDLAVAEDVRVRGAPGLVLGQEVLEDVVPVLGGEVGGVQPDAELLADGLGVRQVFLGGAVFGAVVLVPVLHEQAFDLIALLEQQQGGDGGVDAAGHADDHLAWGGGHGRPRNRWNINGARLYLKNATGAQRSWITSMEWKRPARASRIRRSTRGLLRRPSRSSASICSRVSQCTAWIAGSRALPICASAMPRKAWLWKVRPSGVSSTYMPR